MNPNLIDYFQETSAGLELSDMTFTNKTFRTFYIVGRGRPHRLRNVSFDACKTEEVSAGIFGDAVLKDVEFSNFDAGRRFNIDSEVQLNGVKFVGGRHPRLLWIKPSDESFDKGIGQFDHPNYSLDLTEYHGETIIAGVPIDKVSVDPGLHFKLRLSRISSIDWKEYNFRSSGYWAACVNTLKDNNSEEGVFSFPKDTSEHCWEVIARMREDGRCI